ncbi:MAG: reverse transcriptase domain-containing protein [Chitinophagaceae bacterium]
MLVFIAPPLLPNIMLHELDKELERQGLKYLHYADDFSIYCKSNHAARKTGNKVLLFLKSKLKLTINHEKSGIRKPVQFSILGQDMYLLTRKEQRANTNW